MSLLVTRCENKVSVTLLYAQVWASGIYGCHVFLLCLFSSANYNDDGR